MRRGIGSMDPGGTRRDRRHPAGCHGDNGWARRRRGAQHVRWILKEALALFFVTTCLQKLYKSPTKAYKSPYIAYTAIYRHIFSYIATCGPIYGDI